MNTTDLEKGLIEIINKRLELNKLSYEDEAYDDIEDELHDLEDNFIDKHGEALEDIIADVHDEICPDVDVLSPLSYIGQNYVVTGKNDLGETYDTPHNEGVAVEIDDYLNKPTKLVVIPNPLRIYLNIDRNNRAKVWPAE